MYTEIAILDLQKSQEKVGNTLRNFERLIERFNLTVKSLKSLEERRATEFDGFVSFLDKFYPKDSPYRLFADRLMRGLEREKAETEQTVASTDAPLPTEPNQCRPTGQVLYRH
jgi:hypothetical protein